MHRARICCSYAYEAILDAVSKRDLGLVKKHAPHTHTTQWTSWSVVLPLSTPCISCILCLCLIQLFDTVLWFRRITDSSTYLLLPSPFSFSSSHLLTHINLLWVSPFILYASPLPVTTLLSLYLIMFNDILLPAVSHRVTCLDKEIVTKKKRHHNKCLAIFHPWRPVIYIHRLRVSLVHNTIARH